VEAARNLRASHVYRDVDDAAHSVGQAADPGNDGSDVMAESVRLSKPRISTNDNRRVRPVVVPYRTDPELQTHEHKKWSIAVRRRAGYRCQGAQHDPGKPREGVMLYADHIVERRDGGARYDLGNGQALCASCHVRKTFLARAQRLVQPARSPERSAVVAAPGEPYDPLGFA